MSSLDEILDGFSRAAEIVVPKRLKYFQDKVLAFLLEHREDEENYLQQAYAFFKKADFMLDEVNIAVSLLGGALGVFQPVKVTREAIAKTDVLEQKDILFQSFILPLLKDLLQKRGKDPDFIEKLARLYNTSPEKVLEIVGDTDEMQPLDAIFKISSDATDIVRKGGEFQDYGNLTKLAWGKIVQQLIDRYTEPSQRKDQRVLCFPGIKCLEVDRLLELGYRPENITGVEGSKDKYAQAVFLENAQNRGIRTKLGRLEHIIGDMDVPFDVVLLDFTGQMCKTYLDIIMQLPLNNEAVLLLNVMAHRDSRESQDFYKSLYQLRKVVGETIVPFTQLSAAAQEDSNLSLLRDDMLKNALGGMAGAARRKDILQEIFPKLDQQFYQIFVQAMSDNLLAVERDVMGREPRMNKEALAQRLLTIVVKSLYKLPHLLHHESFEYLSPVGKTKIRYVSDFVKLSSEANIYKKCGNMVAFILKIHRYLFEQAKKGQFASLRLGLYVDKKIKNRKRGRDMDYSYNFVFEDQFTGFQVTIPALQFQNDYVAFCTRMDELDIMSSPMGENIARTIIKP